MPSSKARTGLPPPCPLNLDQKKDPSPCSTPNSPTTDKDTTNLDNKFILDIPLATITLFPENFMGRPEKPFLSKKKRDKRFMDIGDLSLTEVLLNAPEEILNPEFEKLNMSKFKTPALEAVARINKKKLKSYLSSIPTSVYFVFDGERKKIKRTVSELPKERIASIRTNKENQSPKDKPTRFEKLFRCFKLTARAIRTPKSIHPSPTRRGMTKIENLEGFASLKLHTFDFLPQSEQVLAELSRTFSHSHLPDLYKLRAINAWQTGKHSDCAHYLSMAKGRFVESEIIDKHCGYLARAEEIQDHKKSPDVNRKSKIFKLQVNDLTHFQESKETLQGCLECIDKAWNVVEITTDFHHSNRFGPSFISERETPGLFITSHVSIPGSPNRHTFVTYVPKPDHDSGVNNNIMEEFMKVMHKNRLINEGFHGDRRKYWDTRKEHNNHLSSIVDAMEENWIFPWGFLLTGNIPQLKIIKRIKSCILSIEEMVGEIKSSSKGVLYKLIENYNLLPKRHSGIILQYILSSLFNCSRSKLTPIVEKIVQVGCSIDASEMRKPTILVLDQGIDQLPWEVLKIVERTPISRVPSISLIQSLSNIYSIRDRRIIDVKNSFYLLNPDQSLGAVAKRLQKYFEMRPWTGVTSEIPSQEQMEDAIQKKDVYVYCGHGCGTAYISECTLAKLACNSIPLLMGCGSLRFQGYGPKAGPQSTVISYLSSACISMVGYLWEITDLECDRMTVDLIERFMSPSKIGTKPPEVEEFDGTITREPVQCLTTSVLLSRDSPTQYLTKAAIVNYGIPVMSNSRLK